MLWGPIFTLAVTVQISIIISDAAFSALTVFVGQQERPPTC